jgi:hypothetical protein
VTGEGSCPGFGGFRGCLAGLAWGPWWWFGLVRWGRRAGGWGWGELPGSPPRSPALIVTLGAILAADGELVRAGTTGGWMVRVVGVYPRYPAGQGP